MSFLQVASWNVEHLSGRSQNPQAPYALADHIEMAGIDILALQEIYVTHKRGNQRRNRELDRVAEVLKEHLGSDWDYKIFPNRAKSDTSQLCGVFFNASRVTLTKTVPVNVMHEDGGDKLWDRAPHAAIFSTEVDKWVQADDGTWATERQGRSIQIVPLHMKSNSGGRSRAERIRRKEALTLAAEIPTLLRREASLILIGDTNVISADEPAIEVLVDAGLVDLNDDDSATYWSRRYGESPFDRAFVAADRGEFKYTRQYILRSADLDDHDRFLSDHYMIKISVKIYLDDADPRPV